MVAIEEESLNLIKRAMDFGVSDIHLLPKQHEYQILFRLNGLLEPMEKKEQSWGQQCIAYFKFLADMDVGDKRHPQSGAVSVSIGTEDVELRFSTIANYQWQESMVIRILKQEMSHASHLHTVFPQHLLQIQELITRKSGLILFSGPVGSGKTTTIYHFLQERMREHPLQVMTMEDPVEICQPLFLQTQVNEKAGITYDQLIKASLRHHPDILMIGEIRDEETARMVVRGALTGHLMIATIHAKDVLGVLARLEELSISTQQIRQTLIGVISQRLLPLHCSLCGGNCHRYCSYHSLEQKRASVMEVLAGKDLVRYWNKQEVTYKSLNHALRKAWAYGYISKSTYHHYELV